MSTDDNDTAASVGTTDIMTMDDLLDRQEVELKSLESESKLLLKAAKKNNRYEVEARIIQMEYDLKAKHRDEQDALEERIGSAHIDTSHVTQTSKATSASIVEAIDSAKAIEAKKAKAQKKKDKKALKESAREIEKEELRANAGPSLRDIELMGLNRQLSVDGYRVKEVLSDGNCLYRAIADQILLVLGESSYDYIELRQLAAQHLRKHYDDYAPFLDIGSADEFEEYCRKVESSTLAEWGGQVEIRAIADSLHRPILIYDAEAPKLLMGDSTEAEDGGGIIQPLRLTYHRHYYALGEHYNSVEKIKV